MTREAFIIQLCRVFGEEPGSVYVYGRENGWLEQEDELFKEEEINRKTVARILHMYLLKEKEIPDIKDISKAQVLRDLYDCRVCANHVAQIFLTGIMKAKDLAASGGFLWFDLEGKDDLNAIEQYLDNAFEYCDNYKRG